MQFAVMCMEKAETHFKLISSMRASTLPRLTKYVRFHSLEVFEELFEGSLKPQQARTTALTSVSFLPLSAYFDSPLTACRPVLLPIALCTPISRYSPLAIPRIRLSCDFPPHPSPFSPFSQPLTTLSPSAPRPSHPYLHFILPVPARPTSFHLPRPTLSFSSSPLSTFHSLLCWPPSPRSHNPFLPLPQPLPSRARWDDEISTAFEKHFPDSRLPRERRGGGSL
jgi:hypothetical protein